MPEQIFIGNFGKGLKNDRLPFNIDNDAFPTLFNFYAWRGRIKRKRGTSYLGQLTIQFESVTADPGPDVWDFGPMTLSSGSINLFTFIDAGNGTLILPDSILPGASIVPGTIDILDTTSGTTYTDVSPYTGILTATGGTGTGGTINYATGVLTINSGGSHVLTGTFSYYSALPVMALPDLLPVQTADLYPLLMAFDTQYSYQINGTQFYNTTYYTNGNPFIWNGQDYQQFWTTNYSNVLWATNNNPGLHLLTGTYVSGSGTKLITFNFKLNGNNYTSLVDGDVLWFNEWYDMSVTLNGITGEITDASAAASGNYVVKFVDNETVSGTGIVQVLTNSILNSAGSPQDGIRYYTGDPTSHTGLPTGSNLGWVNFAPPLTGSAGVSIDNRPEALYYLVGALAILQFKDRLLFFSPYIQTSAGVNSLYQLQDAVIWSWNGTPFYTVNDAANDPTDFIVPAGETANVKAYYVDQSGLGGYLAAGIPQPIKTISNNEDALLIGFGGDGRKTRFIYTSNDLQPFLFFNINSELPSAATFSAVALDRGVLDIGQYGLAMTDQQSSQRVDLDIPDEIFEIQALNNGMQRVNAIRDFYKEWIYFSYPVQNSPWKFPTQTFLFNYRDNTWAILYENFTAHGTFRKSSKRSWLTTGFKSWDSWKEPWNSSSSSPLFPEIVAGNPQGYVLIIGQGTGESPSGTISAITNNGGNAQITSYNHCVAAPNQNLIRIGDYLQIQGCIGITALNNLIVQVVSTVDANNFVIDQAFPSGTYLGLGTFTRLSQPLLQTKQFPVYWQEGRQVRLGVQKYLLDRTTNGQCTLNIYLSQDPEDVWNSSFYNDALIYSQILYTCPETANIGLTPANFNLQNPIANIGTGYQIWHRVNTSLQGDTFQIGITLSDAQMRNLTYATSEIALQGIQLTVHKGPLLS